MLKGTFLFIFCNCIIVTIKALLSINVMGLGLEKEVQKH